MDAHMHIRPIPRTTPHLHHNLRRAYGAITDWWERYSIVTTSAPGELTLAVTSVLWAVLLWLPTRAFQPGSSFVAIVTHLGSEVAVAVVVTVLAVCQVVGLVLDGRSPHLRAYVTFAVALWWALVAIEGALYRWATPTWVLASQASWLAWLVWQRMRRDLLAYRIHREVHAEQDAVRSRRARRGHGGP